MEMESCIPLGFRFHPTEEELVGYYLQKKINCLQIDLNVIGDIDLYQMEPWEIQDKCKMGYEDQNEWYFFSHKDKKYPTGTRTNRATTAGFWKATGRDKAVLSKETVIGMRKTLVFYKGRAPNGRKTDWIMHEYRLQTSQLTPPQEEGWVVCRAFKKPCPSYQRQGFEVWNHASSSGNNKSSASNVASQSYYSTATTMAAAASDHRLHQSASCLQQQPINNELEQLFGSNYHLVELPKLDDSPSLSTTSFAMIESLEAGRKDWDDTITNIKDYCDDDARSSKYIDRQNLGQRLARLQADSTSLMSSQQLSTDFCDLGAQNQACHGHLMGCYPDLHD